MGIHADMRSQGWLGFFIDKGAYLAGDFIDTLREMFPAEVAEFERFLAAFNEPLLALNASIQETKRVNATLAPKARVPLNSLRWEAEQMLAEMPARLAQTPEWEGWVAFIAAHESAVRRGTGGPVSAHGRALREAAREQSEMLQGPNSSDGKGYR